MSQDWVCAMEWDQATLSDGLWVWRLYLVKPDGEGKPSLTKLVSGTAFTRLSVYWQVWRQCRKHNLRFRPWSQAWRSGRIKDD
jgi:hypothetical protein